jgi:kynureninase
MTIQTTWQSPADLTSWRQEFPILSRKTYLVSHSMGAMPRRAEDYLKQYTTEWGQEGIEAWDHWEPYVMAHGNLVGGLLNAAPDTVIMHQNVSTLMAIVISALYKPGAARRKVVATDLNFPSILYNWEMYASLGLEMELIKSPDGMTIPLEAWEAAIDENTLAVLVDHGVFRSGFLQDAAAITQLAHAKGAYAVVDAYQTIGAVPVDVQAWNADFVLGGSHKWLCGGPGASWLYIRPDLIPALEPRVTGWFSHARPFDFALNMEFAPNAMRFVTSTPGIPALYAARAGTEIIREVGVETIRANSLRMTRRIMEEAQALGMELRTPVEDERRTGMVCFEFPDSETVYKQLLSQGFLIDHRPRCGIRMSPHFYTGAEEIDLFFEALRALIGR